MATNGGEKESREERKREREGKKENKKESAHEAQQKDEHINHCVVSVNDWLEITKEKGKSVELGGNEDKFGVSFGRDRVAIGPTGVLHSLGRMCQSQTIIDEKLWIRRRQDECWCNNMIRKTTTEAPAKGK